MSSISLIPKGFQSTSSRYIGEKTGVLKIDYKKEVLEKPLNEDTNIVPQR